MIKVIYWFVANFPVHLIFVFYGHLLEIISVQLLVFLGNKCLYFSFKEHEKLHTGIRPFKCEHCDKSFASSKTLKIHLDTHRTTKDFSCEEEYFKIHLLIRIWIAFFIYPVRLSIKFTILKNLQTSLWNRVSLPK